MTVTPAEPGDYQIYLEPGAPQPPSLPPFVRRHFVHTGDQSYYRQSPERLEFTMRGESFRAEDASVSVATALVDLAESRGWSALRVTGSKEFRRIVWATAAKRGLSVDGYSPNAGERAMLEQEPDPGDEARDAKRAESRTSGRQRFQELYDQAKARLEARDRLQGTSMPTQSAHQDRDRVVQGR